MGMQQSILFEGDLPNYEAVRDLLEGKGFTLQMAIIDGELSFPDELPGPEWNELRVKSPNGMITIRRSGNTMDTVTWENADGPMLKAWNAITWALASVGNGRVFCTAGDFDADGFQQAVELPDGF